MPSLRYHLFRSIMLLMRHAQGRMPVGDIDRIVRFRNWSEPLADALMPLPRRVKMENAALGGVNGDWLQTGDVPDAPVLVFLHGGGIFFGWRNANRRILAFLAQYSGLRAFGVDFRLTPQHCYPAAHEDCFAVYQALVRQGKQVILVGESSGGVLALATLLRARSQGLPQPLLCAFISPVVDYGFKDGRIGESRDVFAHPRFTTGIHQHYIAGNDTNQPDLCPVDADLRGLAPLVVLVGEHDILRGEAERLAQAAGRHHLPLELILWPHVWHAWHGFVPILPEAAGALRHLGAVIRQHAGLSQLER